MKLSINYCILVLATISIILISGCGQQQSQNAPQDNSQSAPSSEGRPPTVLGGCPSMYDGTYQGIFTYEYKEPIKDANGLQTGEYRTVTSGISATITLECLDASSEGVSLKPTHAVMSHPRFGCQVGGCVPENETSWAYLPAEPTTVGNPPANEYYMSLYFSSGTSLWIGEVPGTINVGVGGLVLSNSLDPAYQCRTWFTGRVGEVPLEQMFPEEAESREAVINVCYKSWILSKTT